MPRIEFSTCGDNDSEISRNEKITVGTSSIQIAPRRKRTLILLRNTSSGTQKITVCFGFKEAVVNEGAVLEPGDVIVDANSEGYKCWQDVITAISDSANGQLSIHER